MIWHFVPFLQVVKQSEPKLHNIPSNITILVKSFQFRPKQPKIMYFKIYYTKVFLNIAHMSVTNASFSLKKNIYVLLVLC